MLLHSYHTEAGKKGRYHPDDILKRIFSNENIRISIKMLLKFVSRDPIHPSIGTDSVFLRRPGGKPLAEPMMVSLLTHICVTRP